MNLPSVLSAKCCRKVFSPTRRSMPALAMRALSSIACLTKGSSHCRITFVWGAVLSPNSSNSGQKYPSRPLVVIICWAISKAHAKLPHESSVADPLGPMTVSPGIGSVAERVSKFLPKRNSDAASMVNRAYTSCTSHGSPDDSRAKRRDMVRVECLSKISKSDMRSRAKKGRAIVRC